jgi:hypothetical protein
MAAAARRGALGVAGLVVAMLALPAAVPAAEPLPAAAQRVYELAQESRFAAEARRLGPGVVPTTDGKSFAVVWKPTAAPERWVVSLHGSRGFATDDLALWHPHLDPARIGFIGLQWWLGQGDGPAGYYSPEQIARELDAVGTRAGVRARSALLHGFSRGASNLYAVAALTAARGNLAFSLFVASSGGAMLDYPPTRAIGQGTYGPRPLARTRWITACGERDPQAERDGCPGMRRTARWLAEQGAEVVLAIEDPLGGHGVLQRDARNVERVLRVFEGRSP